MKINSNWKLGAAVGTALSMGSGAAFAGPHGFDLHNVFHGASAAMAGTSIAHVEDPVSAVFGNPATLTTYYGGTNFMFGATFYMPRARMQHDGSAGYAVGEAATLVNITNGATGRALAGSGAYGFDATSKADVYAVPTVAVTQDLTGLGIPVVLGVGVSATSGIGVNYTHNSNTLGAAAELINLGVNAGIGMAVTPNLDVGVSATITYAMLEAGLTGSGTMVHDIGFRATLGGRMKVMPGLTVGAYVQTEQPHEYDNLHVTSMAGSGGLSNGNGIAQQQPLIKCNQTSGNVCRQDVRVEQPMNIGLGFAFNGLMNGNLLVMADITHKAWSDARFFNEFYEDQEVYSVGLQLTQGPLKWRLGYGYADDPLKDKVADGVQIKTIGGVNADGSTYTAAMYPLFMSYFQAMETPVIYKHRISAGLGIDGFLAPMLTLDTHVAFQLEEDKCFGANQEGVVSLSAGGSTSVAGTALTGGLARAGCAALDHTKATVSSFHLGGSLTWTF
ncbi:MAG: long-chain fatty acid transport protein [Gammaproteobacteria bacterium]|jgi:long-chain fatty acid transport protein|tara:strand:+ start:409 stop:1914 length:1506 start_codon:yes stop_codon:yes gene_type:complete